MQDEAGEVRSYAFLDSRIVVVEGDVHVDEQEVGADSVEGDAYGEEDTAVAEAGDDSDVAHIGDDAHTDSGRSHLAFVEAEGVPIQVQVDTVRRYFGEEAQRDVEVAEYGGEAAARNEVGEEEVGDVLVDRMDDDVHVEVEVDEIEYAQEVEGVAGVGIDYASNLALAEPAVVVVVVAAKAAAHMYEVDNVHD